MIDGIGDGKANRIGLARIATERAAPAAKATGDGAAASRAEGPVNPAADMAAAGPPVNADKIAVIKAAIAEGRYPVDPDKIAERMVALDLWRDA